MRILFCTTTLGVVGGIPRVTIVKANALAEIPGNEVAICFTDKCEYPELEVHKLSPKIKVYDLETPYWGFGSFKNLVKGLLPVIFKTKKAIEKIIEEFQPDVVVSTGTYEKFAISLIRSKGKFIKLREIHFSSNYRRHLEEDSAQGKLAKPIEFFEYNVLSHFFDKTYLLTNRDMNENFPRNKRFDYMYNPSSFNPCSEEELRDARREKVVLSVGRVVFAKNIEELVEIWSEVAKEAPEWKLKIIGSGSSEKIVKDRIKALGVEDSVEMCGRSLTVRKDMLEGAVFVMTSRFEGFGLTLVEAQSMGLPIVSYDTPYGPDEIVNDGKDGFIVKYGDKKTFKDKLLQLIHDEELRERMSEAAHKRSFDFRPDVIASAWMSKYNELLAEKTGRKC